jgi:hypothetical protein
MATYPLLTVERDYLETTRRYPNLYIVSDFTKTIACWISEVPVGDLPLNRFVPFACDNETRDKSNTNKTPSSSSTSSSIAQSTRLSDFC